MALLLRRIHPRRPRSGDRTDHCFIRKKITERGQRNLREQIADLDTSLVTIVNARNKERSEAERINIEELEEHYNPLRRVAYIARQFFDCQMLFVTLRQP
jgi:hypothetical protein